MSTPNGENVILVGICSVLWFWNQNVSTQNCLLKMWSKKHVNLRLKLPKIRRIFPLNSWIFSPRAKWEWKRFVYHWSGASVNETDGMLKAIYVASVTDAKASNMAKLNARILFMIIFSIILAMMIHLNITNTLLYSSDSLNFCRQCSRITTMGSVLDLLASETH